MRVLEALQDVGQEVRADREHRRDLQRAARPRPEVVDRLAGERHGLEELLGERAKGAPRSGGGEAVLAALEEPHAERVLECPDPCADGGLGDPQRLRGAAEASEGADRQERLDLRDFHYPARGVSIIDKYILSRL